MTQWTADSWLELGGLHTIEATTPDDLFLACASHEPRTTFAAEHVAPTYKARRGVIYVNGESCEGDDENKTKFYLNTLSDLLGSYCDTVTVAKGSWQQSDVQLQALKEGLVTGGTELPTDATVTIDTTTFNRDALLTSLALLRTHRPKARIRALYTSPREHGKWLSEGFRTVRNVTGFAGIQRPSQPTLLVILSGFESERALKLIEEHEPVKVLLGIGEPPVAPSFLERNMSEQQIILARQDVEHFKFPVGSIVDAWHCLEDLLKPYLHEYNIVIAPMSTKLSTLGVLLVAERYRQIQITYCVPGRYNTVDYSTDIARFYIEELPVLDEEQDN